MALFKNVPNLKMYTEVEFENSFQWRFSNIIALLPTHTRQERIIILSMLHNMELCFLEIERLQKIEVNDDNVLEFYVLFLPVVR